jgi:RimJ/RimL family protein N-acetyltransferase
VPYPPERLEEMRVRFIERCGDERPEPRAWAMIAWLDGCPLGWVSSYTLADTPDTLFVGIDFCEDAYLNRGLGTEALRLWLDYLCANTGYARMGLETWSLNPRMIRVAEKVGFVLENVKRQERVWQGEPLDLLQFFMVRSEWPVEFSEENRER